MLQEPKTCGLYKTNLIAMHTGTSERPVTPFALLAPSSP